MTAQEKKVVLEDIVKIAPVSGTAEAEAPEERLAFFLAQNNYQKLADPNVFVIEGGRGSGKTKLFYTLTEANGYQYVAPAQTRFGQPEQDKAHFIKAYDHQGSDFPNASVCDALLEKRQDIQAFWVGCICILLLTCSPVCNDEINAIAKRCFAPDVLDALNNDGAIRRPSQWVPQIAQIPEDWEEFFRLVDNALYENGEWIFFTYDSLDKICTKYDDFFPYIRTLLQFWYLHVNRLRRIKSKIFLRSDLLESRLLNFADSSKLKQHKFMLEWNCKSLNQLLVKRIANSGAAGLAYVKNIEGLVKKSEAEKLGWIPTEDESLLESFIEMLIGKYMGSAPKSGKSYPWVTNHIQDVNGVTSPRPFLKCFVIAGQKMLDQGTEFEKLSERKILAPQYLQAAIMEVSADRVKELQEEYLWLEEAKFAFRGLTMLMDKQDFINKISMDLWSTAKKDMLPGKTSEEIFTALQNLGIVYTATDGRVNVPEIYLHGFGMKRSGGVKRLK